MTTRARDLGVFLNGSPGALNSITDVAGVEVGYTTLGIVPDPLTPLDGSIRTGVTAVLPRGRAGIGIPCAAATFALNGNGEMTGRAWIDESGSLATPIALTNTHSVGAVHSGVIEWMGLRHPQHLVQWSTPVVGETWDGYLNDVNGLHVKPQHAVDALDNARGGYIAEGNVGGGTGMNCYGFKGGTGTSSRVVNFSETLDYTVGVLVQANHGSRAEFVINGAPLGKNSSAPCPIFDTDWLGDDRRGVTVPGGAGSVIVVVATDAPLLPNQLQAMLRRVPLGLARNGTTGSHFSGDIFVGFSTANAGALASVFPSEKLTANRLDSINFVPWGYMDDLFTAVVEATEEAVLNALVAARDMTGRDGHQSFALPHAEIRSALS